MRDLGIKLEEIITDQLRTEGVDLVELVPTRHLAPEGGRSVDRIRGRQAVRLPVRRKSEPVPRASEASDQPVRR